MPWLYVVGLNDLNDAGERFCRELVIGVLNNLNRLTRSLLNMRWIGISSAWAMWNGIS